MEKVQKDILKKLYPARPHEVKKYDYGALLVIGGGEFYSGAPALAAFAAFRAGVDMVQVVAPSRAADIVASFSPIVAAYPLKGTHVLKDDLAELLEMTYASQENARGNFAVAIGGGLGRSQETLETVAEYLSQVNARVVIDGDAIHAISKDPSVIAGKQCIVTPNTFELTLLGGKDVRPLGLEERIAEVRQVAAKLNTTILLKVATDIISNGKEVLLNESGTPYMSVAGAGDTLSGIAGALLARKGSDPMLAAAGGAYINGRAGEIAAQEWKESLVATDIIDAIPEAIS